MVNELHAILICLDQALLRLGRAVVDHQDLSAGPRWRLAQKDLQALAPRIRAAVGPLKFARLEAVLKPR